MRIGDVQVLNVLGARLRCAVYDKQNYIKFDLLEELDNDPIHLNLFVSSVGISKQGNSGKRTLFNETMRKTKNDKYILVPWFPSYFEKYKIEYRLNDGKKSETGLVIFDTLDDDLLYDE